MGSGGLPDDEAEAGGAGDRNDPVGPWPDGTGRSTGAAVCEGSRRACSRARLRSVADLRGKKVSVNVIGSATEFWLHSALLRGGLTIDDVQLVAVNFPEVPAALANGAIAAGLLGEPLATLAEGQGQIVRLSEDFVNGIQVTAVYYSGDFIRRSPKLATGFMIAWLQASRDLYGDGYRLAWSRTKLDQRGLRRDAACGGSSWYGTGRHRRRRPEQGVSGPARAVSRIAGRDLYGPRR